LEVFLKALGIKLRELREKAGMTQAELAKMTEIKQSQISKYENGQRDNLSIVTLCRISSVLGCKTVITFPRRKEKIVPLKGEK